MKDFFRHPLVVSFLIIALMTALSFAGWLGFVENAFLKTTSFFRSFAYSSAVKAAYFLKVPWSFNELSQKNYHLAEENRSLLGELARIREIEEENELLKKQLSLPKEERKKMALASVISQDPLNTGEYILIDKGRQENIKEGAAVVSSGNLLVGRVVKVTKSFSTVQLASDPQTKINVRIQGSDVGGLMEGNGGDSLIMNLIPQGAEIEQDAFIVTSNLAKIFPAGLLVGWVKDVYSSDVDICQKAKIEPAADLSSLRKVFVFVE